MSTLKELSQDILTEKDTKILPENIKKDVEIFDVIGTLDADISQYIDLNVFGSVNGKDYTYTNYAIKKLPENIQLKSGVTTLYYAFAYLRAITEIPYFDTSGVTNMRDMFIYCEKLVTVPVYDTSNLVTTSKSMENMFGMCHKLSDESLDNILQMCINAPSGMPGRNLATLGLTSTDYPATKIQGLPHYSEFVAANWSIGY